MKITNISTSDFNQKDSILSITKIPKLFTSIYIILNLFMFISNPNTYICDPFGSDLNEHNTQSLTRYSNYNNGISCLSLLPSYHHYNNNENHSKYDNPIYFEEECLINTDDTEYLFELFHCKHNNKKVYNSKYNRYHYYYHYDLEKSLKTSYSKHAVNYMNNIMTWYQQFSFDRVWSNIPNQWKITTAFIAIIDAIFVVIIKFLVFEDNYAL